MRIFLNGKEKEAVSQQIDPEKGVMKDDKDLTICFTSFKLIQFYCLN